MGVGGRIVRCTLDCLTITEGGREAAEYAADPLWTNIQWEGCDCCESDTAKKVLVQGFRKTHEDTWTVRRK